mmetsp:Transcript_20300/g.35228  ORF Transcript_20300/g.35228 Transcript_20300/m.35228 type:complete len:261 (+) Transcript_20300:151-933(+)
MPLMRCTYCSGIGFSTISPFSSGQDRFISELFEATTSVLSEERGRVTTIPSVLSIATAATVSSQTMFMRWQLTTSQDAMALWKVTRVRLQPSTTMLLHLPLMEMVAPTQPRMYTVSFLSWMAMSTTPCSAVWYSTCHLLLAKAHTGGCFITTAAAAGALGAALTTGAGASPPLYSSRQVCMSLVTFFKPEVIAASLLSAAKRSALAGPAAAGAAAAGLAAGAATGAATGAAAAPALLASYSFTSTPLGFQVTPVVWCSLT